MTEKIIWVAGIFLLSGVFWYCIFYQKEKRLLNRLQQMLDCAIDGELERTEISEEKYSTLENSMKQYLDSNFLARKNQKEQKEVIQKLISDIAHQTLTPISNLKIYGEILSESNHENQEEIDTILEQTEKLDFLIQSLVKLSRMESGIIAVHPEKVGIRQLLEDIRQQFAAKAREKNITLSVCDTDLYVICDLKWTAEALGNIVDNAAGDRRLFYCFKHALGRAYICDTNAFKEQRMALISIHTRWCLRESNAAWEEEEYYSAGKNDCCIDREKQR